MNFQNLPKNIVDHIYTFDPTYKMIYDKSIEFLKNKFISNYNNTLQWFTINEIELNKHSLYEQNLGTISSISYFPNSSQTNSTFIANSSKFRNKAIYFVEYNWNLNCKNIKD